MDLAESNIFWVYYAYSILNSYIIHKIILLQNEEHNTLNKIFQYK